MLVCIVIATITFLTIYSYNLFKTKQIDGLGKIMSEKRMLSDSLSKSYKQKVDKQLWFTNNITFKYGLSQKDGYSNTEIWQRLYKFVQSDSVKSNAQVANDKVLITFIKELGFNSPQKFKSFILTHIINENDIKTSQMASKVDLEIDALLNKILDCSSKIFSKKDQLTISCLAFGIAVASLFLMRYIFYGIVWSIKVLKVR